MVAKPLRRGKVRKKKARAGKGLQLSEADAATIRRSVIDAQHDFGETSDRAVVIVPLKHGARVLLVEISPEAGREVKLVDEGSDFDVIAKAEMLISEHNFEDPIWLVANDAIGEISNLFVAQPGTITQRVPPKSAQAPHADV